MALPPQKFREIVLQLLYSHEFEPINSEFTIPFMMHELKVTKRSMIDVHSRIDSVLEKLPEIDPMIQTASTEYSFERISKVELMILRLALFEMLHDSSIPGKVAIAEAVRLCRKFASSESANFVNAILDSIYKREDAKQQVSV